MCAWTESHQSLLDHRKTLRLARELGVDQVTAIGHLHIFWWWALDNAPDGNLSKIEPPMLDEVVRYHANAPRPKSPSNSDVTHTLSFFSALISAQFVDKKDHGPGRQPSVSIHDWGEYGGK